MRIREHTIPALPFDFQRLKQHLHIEHDVDDLYLADLAWAGIEEAESQTERTFAKATYIKTMRQFPGGRIILKYPPITGLESVKYYDADNVQQTLSADDYYVHHQSLQSLIQIKEQWPQVYCRDDAVTVTYTAGLDYMPPSVRQAVFVFIAAHNENREGEISQQTNDCIDRLLQPWRVYPYA